MPKKEGRKIVDTILHIYPTQGFINIMIENNKSTKRKNEALILEDGTILIEPIESDFNSKSDFHKAKHEYEVKKGKTLFFAVLLLAGFAAQPALAGSLNQDDMAFAFDNSAVSSDLGEMALLSNQEMMETEGEWVPFVIGAFHAIRYAVGPLRSWVRYGSSYSRSGGFRTTSLR